MVMIIGTMDMAVIQFLTRGLADLFNGDIEMQGNTRQGMICINSNVIRFYTHYRNNTRSLLTHGLKLHPHLNVLIGIKP